VCYCSAASSLNLLLLFGFKCQIVFIKLIQTVFSEPFECESPAAPPSGQLQVPELLPLKRGGVQVSGGVTLEEINGADCNIYRPSRGLQSALSPYVCSPRPDSRFRGTLRTPCSCSSPPPQPLSPLHPSTTSPPFSRHRANIRPGAAGCIVGSLEPQREGGGGGFGELFKSVHFWVQSGREGQRSRLLQ